MTGSTLAVTVFPTVVDTTLSPSTFSSSRAITRNKEDSATAAAAHTRHLSTKSLPSLPPYDFPAFDFESDFDSHFECSLPSVDNHPEAQRSDDTFQAQLDRTSMPGSEPRPNRLGRTKSLLGRPQSWMPTSKSSPDVPAVPSLPPDETPTLGRKPKTRGNSPDRPRTASSSLASFSKRSWMSPSRSAPSIEQSDDQAQGTGLKPDTEETNGRGRSSSHSKPLGKIRGSPRKSLNLSVATENEGSKSSDSLTKAKVGKYWTKMKRPQDMLAKGKTGTSLDSPSSSTASIAPPSTGTRDSQTSERSNSSAPDDVIATPKPLAQGDPLLSVFKGLDSDFSKLQSKHSAAKPLIIRSSLLVFLRKYGLHSSNTNLQPEDLERRANILNKWWAEIIELLEGKTQQPVPGVDKPCLFEAVTMLMMRPEWRQTNYSRLADRRTQGIKGQTNGTTIGKLASGVSVDSTDSDYLAESAQHNVRTMFVTNLISQMRLIVEKVSLRHAPLSLVNFAGKACAYAMFFVPGLAGVLVRLWSLSPDAIRRTADEFSLGRWSKAGSDDIAAAFPPPLVELSWKSVRNACDTLKHPVTPPVAVAKIPWHGPWVSRWRGRDTDLFFIFVKYFFILAEEFLPNHLPLGDKARSPGFILVNAQILAVLDSTIHRQAAVESAMGPPLADTMQGVDGSVMAMPLAPNNNVMRGMSENRLVVLLKDFLSGASANFTHARHTFAETFGKIMKAAAKRTSQFDHNACFTICDFLEESLVAYNNFNDPERPGLAYISWPFWFEVLKKIMESNNTMSEIRVLSFIFSIWDAIVDDQIRKETLCLGWLLEEQTFDKFFNHWCPMVRAYFMRLICWRVCRDAGDADELDTDMFLIVSARLKSVWARYLWYREAVEMAGQFPPSTAPCFPAPGKRFLIMRHEVGPPQPGLMMGFDHFSSSPMQQPEPSDPAAIIDELGQADPELPQAKKKWGFIGKVLSFTGGAQQPDDLETLRRDTEAARMKPLPPSKAQKTSDASDTDSMGSSPTFEPMQYVFRFTLQPNSINTIPPPNRILSRPRLPAPAQSLVSAKDRTAMDEVPIVGAPSPTRAVSGSTHAGLIESAKNAFSSSRDDLKSTRSDSPHPENRTAEGIPKMPALPSVDSVTQPTKPIGPYATTVKYAGRALAEWGLVVGECNGFVDRRRDEGVVGLDDIEVPSLGVDGFRKIG